MADAIKDVSNMVFGWAAFHLCRYLLWLAPRTVIVANVRVDEDGMWCPPRGRSLFVRCYFGQSRAESTMERPTDG